MIADLSNQRGQCKGRIERRLNPLIERGQYDWVLTDQWGNRLVKHSFDTLAELEGWLRQRRWSLGPWRAPDPADSERFYL